MTNEKPLIDLMNKQAAKPIETAPLFAVDQIVRVLSGVVDDGQTPPHWAGARCRVLRRFVGGCISKRWVYVLEHPNGKTCEFMEDELDLRFSATRPTLNV